GCVPQPRSRMREIARASKSQGQLNMAAVREGFAALRKERGRLPEQVAWITRCRNLSDHHPFGVRDAPSPALQFFEDKLMNALIYLSGLIVVIMAVLSLFGLR